MSTVDNVLERYAAQVRALEIDEARIRRWIQGITGQRVVDLVVSGKGPFTVDVNLADGSHIKYSLTFEIGGCSYNTIEIKPILKALSMGS